LILTPNKANNIILFKLADHFWKPTPLSPQSSPSPPVRVPIMAAPTTTPAPNLTPAFCFNRTALQGMYLSTSIRWLYPDTHLRLPPYISQRRRRHNLSKPKRSSISKPRRMGSTQYITLPPSFDRQTRHPSSSMHFLQAKRPVSLLASP
jgi:hypothetical protein